MKNFIEKIIEFVKRSGFRNLGLGLAMIIFWMLNMNNFGWAMAGALVWANIEVLGQMIRNAYAKWK